MFRVHSRQEAAGQLSLFPTGSLQQQRQYHATRAERLQSYQHYLGSLHWQRTRREALERDDHRCRNCGCDGELEVHHDTYARRGEEWPEDLRTLCRSCHAWEHERRAA